MRPSHQGNLNRFMQRRHAKPGFLLFKLPEISQQLFLREGCLRRKGLGHHWLWNFCRLPSRSDLLPGICANARHHGDSTAAGIHGHHLCPLTKIQRMHLLNPVYRFHFHARFQSAVSHPNIDIPLIPDSPDTVYHSLKGLFRIRNTPRPIQPNAFKQPLRAIFQQCTPSYCQKDLPICDQGMQGIQVFLFRKRPLKMLLQQIILSECDFLPSAFLVPVSHDDVRMQPFAQFPKRCLRIRSCLVRLIEKEENRNPRFSYLIPYVNCPALNPVCTGNHKNHQVQNRKDTCPLWRKVLMTRCVNEDHLRVSKQYGRLLRENRNAPLALQSIIVHERIPMIHASRFPDASAQMQKLLTERRLSCVHMGHQANADMLFHLTAHLSAHTLAPLFLFLVRSPKSRIL